MIKFYPKKTINRTLQISRLTVITIIAMIGLFIYQNNTANAGVTGWMAGRIIDDSVFTNYNSMSAIQIQTFLNSKVPTCDTNGQQLSEYGGPDLNNDGKVQRWEWGKSNYNQITFPCLRDYVENGKKSAQIIYDTAQTYKINPQVLIVLLQKEQALITDTWPLDIQYRSATGYGCPDTEPCYTQYYGLANQLDWAGKMYHSIMTNSPTWYTPYILGNNTIYYNPGPYNNSASKYYGDAYDKDGNSIPDITYCGGSNVYIQNRATQALYNYTPYQPNTDALNAGWGSATCGAYGNRNFYLYFTNWFGAATSAATYTYNIVSTSFYSDYNYSNQLLDDASAIIPNSDFWVQVVVQNTGNQSWYANSLHLGTTDPKDRMSVFSTTGGTGGWLNPERPAGMSEDNVGNGETATFRFGMHAPANLGSYQESFGLVIDGYRWFSNTFTIPITVSSATPYYSTRILSFDTYSDAAMTKKISSSNIVKYTDSKIYARIIIENTGNQTLSADITKIATTNPNNHTSLYADSSWLTTNRPAAAQEGDILPEQTGTFTFSMTTPSTPLDSSPEQFGLVLENQRWLNTNIGTVSIKTTQRPPSILAPGKIMLPGDILLSKNENYKLILQGDGNLVLYSPTKAIWATYTVGKGSVKLVMQGDGNLVLYTKNGVPVWNSRTAENGSSELNMQGDGNLVVYSLFGYTWSSQTEGKK